jgi:hypothetical protein
MYGASEATANVLDAMCCMTEKAVFRSPVLDVKPSIYYMTEPVPISLTEYVDRFSKFFDCTAVEFYYALCLCYRLFCIDPLLFHTRSIYKIFAGCLLFAVKMLFERPAFGHYCECAGIMENELKMIEANLIFTFGYTVWVKMDDSIDPHKMQKSINALCE